MDQRVKKAYFEEIEYQTKQINRLLTDVNLSGKDIPSSFQSAKEQAESLIAGMK